MCRQAIAEVTSNHAILATPSFHHCRSRFVAVGHLMSLSLLCCPSAVNQFSSLTSSLSLLRCRWAVDQCINVVIIVVASLLCHTHTFIIATLLLSHPYHLQMLLALKNNIAHKGHSVPCPFYHQMDPLIWIILQHPAALQSVNTCQYQHRL